MMKEEVEAKADDSDYYTPEDPHINILSPVKSPSESTEKVSSIQMVKSLRLTKFYSQTERHHGSDQRH